MYKLILERDMQGSGRSITIIYIQNTTAALPTCFMFLISRQHYQSSLLHMQMMCYNHSLATKLLFLK